MNEIYLKLRLVVLKNFFLSLINKNYSELIILYLGTFIGFIFLFNSPNFASHFGFLSTSFFPLITIQDLLKKSFFFGLIVLLIISLGSLVFLFVYIPILNFGIFNTDFSYTRIKTLVRYFLLFLFFILFLFNIIVYTEGTIAFQLLFIVILSLLLYYIIRREQKEAFIRNNLSIQNLSIIIALLAFYALFVYLGISLIGPASDIHVDESLYLTTGRNFAHGTFLLYVTNYPTFPFILSLIIAFSQNQEVISLFSWLHYFFWV